MKTIVYINNEKIEMETNKKYFINGKIYGLCANCKKIVRLDKPLFGDLHLCN